MAALQEQDSTDCAAKRSALRGGPGGRGEAKQKRVRFEGVDAAAAGGGSSAPATAPASLADVTVEDADALDCGVCFLPLKPPIFQCEVGHLVCSLCRDKLQATGKCHVCGVTTGSYHRCHGMERLVESIRVPCSYAAHGCDLRPAYCDQESHRLVCAHAPCHCPGEACSFVGSTTKLLDHFITTHKWPCITTVKPDGQDKFTIGLHDGFNFLLADYSTSNKNQGATASIKCLLLLTVARQSYGCIISVHCIDPHAAAASSGQGLTSKEMQCELQYSLYKGYPSCQNAKNVSCNNPLINYLQHQISTFRVVRTDLSNGLPKPEDCYQFVVSNPVIIGDYDKDGITVKVRITIKE